MYKSARTVIILWLDHVHSVDKPRKENLLHQVFSCYLGQNLGRSLRWGLICQETAANNFRFTLLHFFPAPQLLVILQNRECFELQFNIAVPSRLWQILGKPGWQSPIFEFRSPGQFGLPVVPQGVLCPTVSTQRTLDLTYSCQCGLAAWEPSEDREDCLGRLCAMWLYNAFGALLFKLLLSLA